MASMTYRDGRFVAVVPTEAGGTAEVVIDASTPAEAEAMFQAARGPSLVGISKITRLTADIVSAIVCGRSITMQQAVSEYLLHTSTSGRLSPKTLDNHRLCLGQWMRQVGHQRLAEVDESNVSSWVNDSSAVKRGTRLGRLAAARALFAYAVDKRMAMRNPANLVEVDLRRLSHAQLETEHHPCLDVDHVDNIIARLPSIAQPGWMTFGFLSDAVTIGYDCALRLSDIASLEADSVSHDTITLFMRKTGQRIQLPTTSRVTAILARRKLAVRSGRLWVPEHERNINPRLRSTLSLAFTSAFARLGYQQCGFHSLRAGSATAMALDGATVQQIAERLGHTNTSVTSRTYIRRENAAVIGGRR